MILFDLDGTLVDTTDLILRSFRHVFDRHLPGKLPPREEIVATRREADTETRLRWLDRTALLLIRILAEDPGVTFPEPAEELEDRGNDRLPVVARGTREALERVFTQEVD